MGISILADYVICKYFLLICDLSSHALNNVVQREVLNLDEVQFINYFFAHIFGVILKKSWPNFRSQRHKGL